MTSRRFLFDFEPRVRPAATVFGATPSRTWLDVDDELLRIRFGFFTLTTSLTNVAGAKVTGPYQWFKIAGPPRLSFADQGITFATSTARGACICFSEPVAIHPPYWPLRHPGVTVTVQEPEELVALLDPFS